MSPSDPRLSFNQPDADSPPGNMVRAGTTLKVPVSPVCDGSMVCECDLCELERQERVRTGVRASVQPWGRKAA